MRNGLKSFAEARKIKYGTVSAAFCAIIIAIVILLNSIISVIGENVQLYFDMTEEQIYSASPELLEAIEKIDDSIEIEIIFCTDKDEAETGYADISSGNVLAYVHSTATQIANRCKNVTVSYHDPIVEYDYFNQMLGGTALAGQEKPSSETIIIGRRGENGSFGTHYRIINVRDFYVFTQESVLYGYQGELVFASSIISLTYDKKPVVYFTTGHYEITYETNSEGNIVDLELVNLFAYCGFDVLPIDLSENVYICECGKHISPTYDIVQEAEYICSCGKSYVVDEMSFTAREKLPSDCRMLVINQPKKDFTEAEIKLLTMYLDDTGSVLCFTDPEIPEEEAPMEFYGFLEAWGGVKIHTDGKVTDSSTRLEGKPNSFRGTIPTNDASGEMLSSMTDATSARPMVENSTKLSILSSFESGYGDGTNLDRITYPLITSSRLGKYNGETGEHIVFTATRSYTIKGGAEERYAYLAVCGSSDFASNEYLKSNTYPNKEVIFALIQSTTSAQVPSNLYFKVFVDYELDISESTAQGTMLALSFVPAIIAVAIGFVVIYRRKRR